MTLPTGRPAEQGLYIHVPFCSTRCGYCDFNTYTPAELSAEHAAGNTIPGYLDALERELELAAELWDRGGSTGVDTVFFGGGTPSLLGHDGLNRALRAVRRTLGLAPNAEVTTESNPESTSPEFFDELRAGGFTRVSLGMQSAAGHVLKVLDRRHTPGRPVAAAREARAAGFEHINLDLIYGTPTETDADLRRSLSAVLDAGVDHVSAYSLIVEDGTAMARKVRRGQLPSPDEDVLADRYSLIDATLSQHGFNWYEVSNWARPGGECRHNLIYWTSGQWWGAGPGAHGCVRLAGCPGLTRLVNAKRPATYWNGLLGESQPQPVREEGSAGQFNSPAQPQAPAPIALPGSVTTVEELSEQDIATERIMLGLRLARGVDLNDVLPGSAGAAGEGRAEGGRRGGVVDRLAEVIANYERLGLVQQRGAPAASSGWWLSVTDKGRYLADGIVTDLVLALD